MGLIIIVYVHTNPSTIAPHYRSCHRGLVRWAAPALPGIRARITVIPSHIERIVAAAIFIPFALVAPFGCVFPLGLGWQAVAVRRKVAGGFIAVYDVARRQPFLLAAPVAVGHGVIPADIEHWPDGQSPRVPGFVLPVAWQKTSYSSKVTSYLSI